jgi:hypothetical protein
MLWPGLLPQPRPKGDISIELSWGHSHGVPTLKTWTLTNWAIVTYDSKSNVVYSAGGPYELHGNLYTETVESGTGGMSNYIGAQLQYQLRVKGDKYYQMGSGIEETGQRIQQ